MGKLRDSFKKKELDEKHKNEEFEKGDFLAMVIALSYYLLPVMILFFIVLFLFIRFVF